MDNDDGWTWITGDISRYRNDYFFTKNSVPETTDDRKELGAAPNANKSRAALILTEVEEELERNESDYNTMKDRFDYIKKMISLGAESAVPQIAESKPADAITRTSSPRDIITQTSPVDDEKSSDGGSQYYDFYMDAKQAENKTQDDDEPTEQSPRHSARSYNVSPREDIYLGVGDGNSSDSSRKHYFSGETSGGTKTFFREKPSENAINDNDIQMSRDQKFGDTTTSPRHPYQIHLAEYSKSIHEETEDDYREVEQEADNPSPPRQDEEICFEHFRRSARNHEEAKEEIFLNLSESAESVKTTKKKKSRSEKQRRVVGSATSTSKKNAVKQVDETLCGASKIRRKKLRRVKASNSRSTTATTRDTCFTAENRKETRKQQKQRGHATMPASSQSSQHRPDVATKIQQNSSEVVEIYHNNALKSGSLSVVSSKHSRLEPRGRNVVSANPYDQRSATKESHRIAQCNEQAQCNIKDVELRRSLKSPKNCHRVDGEENRTQSNICHPVLPDVPDPRSGEPNGTELIYNAKSPTIQSDNKISEDCKDAQHRHRHCPERSSAFYDPLTVRSYELPTVASKMKRANRSYFNRFNFRNIPFVVGTSVTPSYNLGLNIQETLSLIKTRQTMPGGVTPLLISKVSKGVRPVTTLLGVGDEDETLEESDMRFDVTSARIANYYPEQVIAGCRSAKTTLQVGPFSAQPPRLTCVPTAETLDTHQTCSKTTDVPWGKKQKAQSVCSTMKLGTRKNVKNNLRLTPSVLLRQRQEELNIGDSQTMKCHCVSQNMNGIREVLVNFHDQFEAMNSKYEKLQEQAETSNDESLKKEIATLEKELTAKEEEINAVVSLYKEVMALKQQMKLLHERNSLVCVTTESPGGPTYPQLSSRAQTANPMFSHYRRSDSVNNQGPSTSTRLAGLLRQIKVFQKQLKSAG